MYDQIARNKRDSLLLVAAVFGLLIALGYVFARAENAPWEIGVGAAVVAGMVASTAAYYGGSSVILSVSGAREIAHDDSPQLFNVVEEMSIAAGLPMPKVYVIDDSAPNAFATGRSPETAAIAITTGLLTKLNRDELQGVIAHEMSHIKNFDTRLLMLLAILVGGIVLLCDLFWRINRWGPAGRGRDRDRDSGSGQWQLVFFAIALVLAILAPFFAKLLEMAVSRHREYLADASAALLTRYPDGLASALQKISSDPEPLEAANRATQHLYIVNPVKALEGKTAGLFDTHPPIEERIARLRGMGLRGAENAEAPAGAGRPTGPVGLGMPGVMGLVGASAGPTVAGASPSTCPRCQFPLVSGRIQGRNLLGCRHCGGIWIGEDDIRALLKEAPRELDAADRKFPNLIGSGWDAMSRRTCPVCGLALVPLTAAGPAPVALDRCPSGHGIWFDDGELSEMANGTQ
ncbi:MAG TPA: M48 family metalloprotease [Armatimonadota bacterium]|jgi:heat shock protein HtpX